MGRTQAMQITRTHHWCVAHPLAIQSIFSLDGIFVDWCGFVDWRGDKPLAVSVAAGGTASLSLHSALRGFPVCWTSPAA